MGGISIAMIIDFFDFHQIVWDLQPGVRGIFSSLLGCFGGSFHGVVDSNRPFLSKLPPIGAPIDPKSDAEVEAGPASNPSS